MKRPDEQNDSQRQKPRLRIRRGIGFASLFGAVGFAVPILVIVGFTVCQWVIEGSNAWDRAYDLSLLPTKFGGAAVITALLFAAAGWAAFAPTGTYRFASTLVLIFAITLSSWGLLELLAYSMGLLPHQYKGTQPPPTYPQILLGILFFAVPILASSVISLVRHGRSQHLIDQTTEEKPIP
jgi:hypothetical protein